MCWTPYDSEYYREIYQQYAVDPNDGTLKELKEEFKSLVAIDWCSFVKKMNYGMLEFKVSDTLREWLKNDPTFSVALSFIDCFFQRDKNDPFPDRIRFYRMLPKLRQKKLRKKYGKRINQDIKRELRGLRRIAKQHCRTEDEQKIHAVRLATFVIFLIVWIDYVGSTPRQISEELFKELCDAAPAAEDIYQRRANGQYGTEERLPAGRLLGQAGADVIIIAKLERFGKFFR